MKAIVPFQGSYPGTAQQHLATHLKLHEKIGLALLLVIGCFFCGSPPHRVDTASHDLSACLSPCAGAQAVITATVPERGAMCRCWAPNAFSYTFSYPVTPEDVDYARQRWTKGVRDAEQCRRKGLGWEPDQSRDNVVCVKPESLEDEPPRKPSQDPINDLQHTSLGRLHPNDWPRFLQRPAWTQWALRRKAS